MSDRLVSCLATQEQLESPAFQAWAARLGRPPGANRKTWEFAFIAQALVERGLVGPGRRGLGFAVGREPLVALFAGMGAELVATDVDAARAEAAGFVEAGDHARGLEDLLVTALCDEATMRRNVRFRNVDLRAIPADLRGFDFVWSACAIEHVGSIDAALACAEATLACLGPGGVAVHTTELNISDPEDTVERGNTVLLRERDVEALSERVAARGYTLTLDLARGTGDADLAIARPPYPFAPHLKLTFDRFVTTSLGLILEPR